MLKGDVCDKKKYDVADLQCAVQLSAALVM